MNTPELSIIIPAHNTVLSSLHDTLSSIKDTIDVEAEIIIVDDGSKPRIPDIEGITVLHHDANYGVGRAFDTGVAAAKADRLFLMGDDIRFGHNQWASKTCEEIDIHPKSLIGNICVGLTTETPDGMDFEKRRLVSRRNCATILFYHDHISHPKKPKNFRNILEAQWIRKTDETSMFEVPCVLGAAYGVSKEWYNYIDGWWGHLSWGSLEPYISLKSWLMGGSCLCDPSIETAHIFKRSGTHGTQLSHLMYNKLLLAHLLMPDTLRDNLISFLGVNPVINAGMVEFNKRKDSIFAKREEYKQKIVYDVYDFCKRFNIDLRNT